ncbi:MAG: 3' terminal RNA ribose 2'-O-methyltransferase Hen1 [Candidatus Obscuribacterales bacterium]
MLLTISTTYQPATDLGFLLYKHPGQVQSFEQSYGTANVMYPEASEERCTVALLLDVDPIDLVRGRKGKAPEAFALQQYVNDRPYAASSFLSVAIADVFGTALAGKCKDRPELAETKIPLRAELPCLPCRGGEPFLRRLFEPLGYEIQATTHQLDRRFPEWGKSPYLSVILETTARLRDLLAHLYVLIPVMDDDKHYWVGEDEVEKLLRHAKGWLPSHPDREMITNRYLKHKRTLTRAALSRLAEEDAPDPDALEESHGAEEEALEEKISLNEQRLGQVLAVLRKAQARRIIDLGCGEGKLLKALMEHKEFEELLGLDVSFRALETAHRRLGLERQPERMKDRLKLVQGSLTYRDNRMSGFDAATCIEVIEHMDEPRLEAFERVLFEFARPRMVVLTTPNAEYNCKFEGLPTGTFRHRDHRFEWTRAQFQSWCSRVASQNDYQVSFLPVGPEDPLLGPPTQMGVFSL